MENTNVFVDAEVISQIFSNPINHPCCHVRVGTPKCFNIFPKWHISPKLTCQMVGYTEPSEKLSLEIVYKRAGTYLKYLTSNWTNHLFISQSYLCKAAGFTRLHDKSHWTYILPEIPEI